MSRWKEAYNFTTDEGRISEISELISQIKTIKLTKSDDILEFARIQKVHKYLVENLKKIDPELLPIKTIKNVTPHFDRIVEYLNNYLTNEDSVYLSDSNTFYDTVLQELSAYFPKGKSTAQAAAAAFKKYSETIENALKQSIEENNALIRSNEEFHQYLKTLRDQAEAYEINLSNVEKKYLTGTEDTPSLKAQFDELLVDSKEWHIKINGLYTELFRAEKGKDSLQTTTLNQISDIQKAIKDANEEITTLNDFYEKVIGTEDEEGDIEGGLEKEVDSRIQALDDYKINKEKIHTDLINRINELLPGATSAGLATAFKIEKEKCSKRVEWYSNAFYISLVSILLVGVYSITKSFHFYPFSWEALPFSDYTSFFENLLTRAPIVIPLALIAWFFSNRRNDYMRLEQEYTHKEAVASTVVSYRKQLEETGATVESELMKNFLAATIEIVQFNPAKTLNKKHKNDASLLNIDGFKDATKQMIEEAKILK